MNAIFAVTGNPAEAQRCVPSQLTQSACGGFSNRKYLAELALHLRGRAADIAVVHRDHFDVADPRAAGGRLDIEPCRVDAALGPELLRFEAERVFGQELGGVRAV